MPPLQHFDAAIIGTGPAGEGAAMKMAKAGKSVVIIERFNRVGGGCTHWGTIPSKTLRESVRQLSEFRAHPLFRSERRGFKIDLPAMLESANSVVTKQADMRRGFYDRNRVPVIEGHAKFITPKKLEITDPRGAKKHITADHFVIAVGTRPYRPPGVDFDHPRILDSDKILGMTETPRTMTIYGAGVIGCEYASILRALDTKLNLVNTRAQLLSFLDDEIVDALAYHLRDRGVLIRHNEEADKVTVTKKAVTLHLKSGKKLSTDYLLWANGRAGNTDDLGADKAGIKVDHRGLIVVDKNYRTNVKHIFAVGDVVGFPSLASASYDQGRFAATHIIDGKCDQSLIKNMPTGIYTDPEISSVGATEKELTKAKVPYEVGRSLFRSLARAQITGRTSGMLKILFHCETLEILGVHCFGDQASEIIHIGQAVMSQKEKANSLEFFINTTFNYPTMAEAYRVAALNGLNRVS
ncbi:MAG: Si-specific NAD(P)(+) transhydrogenase [Elusimicrobia bacterium]|nr:MAG: Si-specific NAD(P)(+) transhydrogenase [Elusimicrobiota bacterium]